MANEQEHGFELWDDFFWRKTKCLGAGRSGGGPREAHEAGGAPQGGGRALCPRGQMVAPGVFSVPKILKYSTKIILHFQGIWRTFILGVFFIPQIIQKTDRNY